MSIFSAQDIYLFSEGNLHRAYEKMGAHPLVHEGRAGVSFAVWAPNARAAGVAGDFNGWSGARHQLAPQGTSGIWWGFSPGLKPGALYKFEITAPDGRRFLKSDPYAFYGELRPGTASAVWLPGRHAWRDRDWLEARKTKNPSAEAVSIYEAHLGSWARGEGNRFLNYRELALKLAAYLVDNGFTHLEILPVAEHPLDESWGYQTTGYFAPTSRHGTPDDFAWFVDHLHQAGIGVIVDWTPAHFPADEHGLAHFDGTCLYEHLDERQKIQADWGTHIFNYGRAEVASFLLNSALFWLDRFHIDGLRVDAVASMLYLDYSKKPGQWVPNRHGGNENLEAIAFLQKFNRLVYQYCPGAFTVAEESTAWPMVSRPVYAGGLGFGFKWNMGWMHDGLAYIGRDPVYRRYEHHRLTFGLLYAFHENFVLPLSHDEVVHGKGSLLGRMPGDDWRKFANLRLFFGYMFTHPGKKLLFMGGEFGQWAEWDCGRSLDWRLLEHAPHRRLARYVGDLNRLYRAEKSLYEQDHAPEGFAWVEFSDTDSSVLAYERFARGAGEFVLVVCNFTPVVRHGYRVGVSAPGFYRELLNSDSAWYGGSNAGNQGGGFSDDIPWHNRPCSLALTLPPLGILVLKRRAD